MQAFRVKVYGRGAGPVVFFFCPFNIPSWQAALPGLPVWRLVRAGYRVVVYDYDATIATVSAQVTLGRFEAILGDAASRLRAYNVDGVREFYAFGTSMGTNFAINLAARHLEVTKVVLNLSYSNVADHIIAMPALKLVPRSVWDRYLEASGGEVGMHRNFDAYAPLNLASQMTGKQVLLYLARRDRLLQYRHTRQLLERLRSSDCELTYYENPRASHYWAALRNGLGGRQYLQFFGQDAVGGAREPTLK